MEKEAAYIAKLIYKSKLEQLTSGEAADLQAWLSASSRNSQLYEELQGEAAQREAMGMMNAYRGDDIRARILAGPQDAPIRPASSQVWRLRRWLPYAAAVIVALSVGFFFWEQGQRNEEQGQRNKEQALDLAAANILPGGNRATLTLADGRIINLDDAQTGIIVGDEDIKYQDGTSLALAPTGGGEGRLGEIAELVLSTPKGGTYQVTLPDGSKVWLNSASTLKYPSRFSDTERIVELTGEAYFDIAQKQRTQPAGQLPTETLVPFLVKTNGQTVEVLGTEFNISAYGSDPEIKTTLVEGKVNVAVAGGAQAGLSTNVLTPGQQAITRGAHTEIKQVDVDQYTAWKEGWMIFQDKSFDQIMREVERWYDIEVRYEGTIPREVGYGMTKRTENLSVVLQLLESGGIRFRLDDRILTIVNQKGG
ncbi:FecR domain-containing protein [Parapedobacter sp. 2B3]|uniref:FecR domain-containing protein n=1 Tax=Parapedobacter sp. 2B3 TaxID=3342381 RepID=UPI0035B5A5DF